MVYNAMKLFMEVNPQLFDDCSHEYTESQNSAEARKRERLAKWDKLAGLAKQMQNGAAIPKTITHTSQGIQGPHQVQPPDRPDDIDPMSRESSRRLENLNLGDDNAPDKVQYERQASANSVR